MVAAVRRAYLLSLLAGATLATAGVTIAVAADVSPWDEDLQSAARLIAAPAHNTPDGGVFRAGVEIKLKDGWHTYWRYPGDSGVPPVLDFSKSQNVKTVTVLYPAPTRFPDGAGGNSVGYTGDVIWPIHVVAENPGKPVTLDLKLDYAVCEKLCVPAKAAMELSLSDAGAAKDAALGAAESKVPKPAKLGAGGKLAIRAVHRENAAGKESGKPRIVVAVAADEPVTLFAEGPTPQWALPLPEPMAGPLDGLQRFAFELDGLPPGAKAEGATLRLTAVSGGEAIEVAFRLD
jgi:DsbC/DsbD-like thiol-disulfide interchange protein